MSEFSTQIVNVLDNTLVPEMKQLVSSIALIEPYSIDSIDLKERYEELARLTSIYDYLHEYEIGNEEMLAADLIQIVRMTGNMSINLQPEIFDPQSNNQTQVPAFFVYIDGNYFIDGDPVTAGLHDVEVRYSGECAVTKLIYKQKLVGAPGKTVYMQNASFEEPGGELEFRAYGNNTILLTTATINYVIGTPVDRIPNVLDTLGLPTILEI